MKKQILLAIVISFCFVASVYAQSEPEKRNLSEILEKVSKTTITFRYLDDEPQIIDSNDNLNRTVAVLKANPQLKLIVECYANDYKSEQENRDLAQRRAKKVCDIFIKKGIAADQIETVTYSANDPENNRIITNPQEYNAAFFRIEKKQ